MGKKIRYKLDAVVIDVFGCLLAMFDLESCDGVSKSNERWKADLILGLYVVYERENEL